jgi:hypothetical protein
LAVRRLLSQAVIAGWSADGLGGVMAASSGSADTGNNEKPTFTFEQFVLRFVAGAMFLHYLYLRVAKADATQQAWTEQQATTARRVA